MKFKWLVLIVFSCSAMSAFSQTTEQEVKDLIIRQDSLFWIAYNNCDAATMEQAFTEDLEFYHDKGGPTNGREALMNTIKNNLCGGEVRLRREAVPGTVQVYSMNKNGVPYGAVISGEHLFYVNQKGKAEFPDGRAHFTHLWIVKDGKWVMSRILSYNHHAANKH